MRLGERVPHGQRGRARARARAARAARLRPARQARADRDDRRLRHLVVRRLHGAARRRVGEVVHRARRPGRRPRDHDDRGAGGGRRLASAPGELPHEPRAAVRLLHLRDGARGGEPAGREPASDRAARSGTRSRGTSAAAPATRTSSTRSRRWPNERARRGRGRPCDRRTRRAQGGSEAPARPGPVGRQHARPRHGLPRRSCAARMPTRASRRSTSRPRSRTRTSSRPGPAPISPRTGRARCRARGCRPRTRTHPNHAPLAVDRGALCRRRRRRRRRASRAGAEDAAELVEVDYEPLPAVVDAEAALADGAPLVHEEFGTNECYTWKLGRRRGRPAVRRGGRHRQRALPPEPPDPERDRATGDLRPAAPGERRVHACGRRRRCRTSRASR